MDSDSDDLRRRVARLEEAVSDLRETVEELQAHDRGPSRSPTSDPPAASETHFWTSRLPLQTELSTEEWLGRVGIGLLLFGLIFLFKYSIAQGWIGPIVRVGFGATVGSVLLGVGLRMNDRRQRIRQVFLGGSSAAFYATGFAAHQLYSLLSFPVAFAGMTAVTLLTFVLALREDAAALGVIGTAGGLGTPFLLYSDAGSVPGLVAYTCLILTGAVLIYRYRGWRTLLGTTVVGGWLVLLIASFDAGFAEAPRPDRWALQAGLLLAGILFAGVPVWRALERPSTRAEEGRSLLQRLQHVALHALVTTTPFLVLGGARMLWTHPSGHVWSGIAVGAAALYATASMLLRQRERLRFASAHAFAAAVLLAYGLSVGLDGGALRVALALEGLAALQLAQRLGDGALRGGAHALFAALAYWLVIRFQPPPDGTLPLSNPAVWADLAVIGLGLLASTRLSHSVLVQNAYRVAAWTGWLWWTWSALQPLPGGHAYVSSLWALTGLTLLVGGTWRQHLPARYVAGATLLLFVGKLFLVDLSTLSALLRIVLFLGAGAAFLALSYTLPGLFPAPADRTPLSPDTEG